MKRLLIDPRWLDIGLALVLLVAAEVAVWWGRGGVAREHPIGVAVIAAVITAAVAVRRRYPFTVGVGAVGLSSFQIAFWGDPQLIPTSIAFFLLLYAFTVWTPPRSFAVGVALLIAIF